MSALTSNGFDGVPPIDGQHQPRLHRLEDGTPGRAAFSSILVFFHFTNLNFDIEPGLREGSAQRVALNHGAKPPKTLGDGLRVLRWIAR